MPGKATGPAIDSADDALTWLARLWTPTMRPSKQWDMSVRVYASESCASATQYLQHRARTGGRRITVEMSLDKDSINHDEGWQLHVDVMVVHHDPARRHFILITLTRVHFLFCFSVKVSSMTCFRLLTLLPE